MCFMPCLATASAPTLTPFGPVDPPQITLYALRHCKAADLEDKFTLPHRAHIGLIFGCGCYLRYVETWPSYATVEDIVQQPDYSTKLTQPNHDALVDYLLKHFRQDGFVEFYGYWGEAAEPPKERLEIPVEAIRHPHFHFRAGAVYRIAFDAA